MVIFKRPNYNRSDKDYLRTETVLVRDFKDPMSFCCFQILGACQINLFLCVLSAVARLLFCVKILCFLQNTAWITDWKLLFMWTMVILLWIASCASCPASRWPPSFSFFICDQKKFLFSGIRCQWSSRAHTHCPVSVSWDICMMELLPSNIDIDISPMSALNIVGYSRARWISNDIQGCNIDIVSEMEK